MYPLHATLLCQCSNVIDTKGKRALWSAKDYWFFRGVARPAHTLGFKQGECVLCPLLHPQACNALQR